MKTTIMHLLSLFLIVAFTASCGKKDSGSSSAPVSSSLNMGGLTGTSLENAQRLNSWYADTTSNGSTPIGGTSIPINYQTWKVERSNRTYTESCKKVLGIINACVNKPTSTVISTTTVGNVIAPVVKASYPALAAVMNNSLGTIINIQAQASSYGAAVYIIDILKADGKYIAVTIDTNVHPAFNPISTYNYDTKVEEYVSNIKLPY